MIADSAIKDLDGAYGMGLGSVEVAVLTYALQHNQIALADERRAGGIAL